MVTVYLHVAPAEVRKTWTSSSIPSYDPHGIRWNFILVFIFVYIFLLFYVFSPVVLFFVSFLSHSSFLRTSTLFHASCPCILITTAHAPTLVALLSMNMLLTVDHSNLGHDVVHLGKHADVSEEPAFCL